MKRFVLPFFLLSSICHAKSLPILTLQRSPQTQTGPYVHQMPIQRGFDIDRKSSWGSVLAASNERGIQLLLTRLGDSAQFTVEIPNITDGESGTVPILSKRVTIAKIGFKRKGDYFSYQLVSAFTQRDFPIQSDRGNQNYFAILDPEDSRETDVEVNSYTSGQTPAPLNLGDCWQLSIKREQAEINLEAYLIYAALAFPKFVPPLPPAKNDDPEYSSMR